MEPRIPDPILYRSDVNETHSRFDYIYASPSHDDLYIQFVLTSIVTALTSAFLLVFMASLFQSSKIWTNCFHMYILGVTFPDFLSAFSCIFVCALSATKSEFWSERSCGFQAWFLAFGIVGNAWTNALITYEVHKILRFSSNHRKYHLPSMKSVLCQIGAVYVYATIIGLFSAFSTFPGMPLRTQVNYGFFCFAQEKDRNSTIFLFLVWLPLLVGIPMVYFTAVAIDIWKRNLLPPKGKRRSLALFMLRLVFIYYAVWTPFFITQVLGNFILLNNWFVWVLNVFAHLQSVLTAMFCLSNPSIQHSFFDLVFCGRWNAESAEQRPSQPALALSSSSGYKKSTNSSDYYGKRSVSHIRSSMEEGGEEEHNKNSENILGQGTPTPNGVESKTFSGLFSSLLFRAGSRASERESQPNDSSLTIHETAHKGMGDDKADDKEDGDYFDISADLLDISDQPEEG